MESMDQGYSRYPAVRQLTSFHTTEAESTGNPRVPVQARPQALTIRPAIPGIPRQVLPCARLNLPNEGRSLPRFSHPVVRSRCSSQFDGHRITGKDSNHCTARRVKDNSRTASKQERGIRVREKQ